MDRSRRRQYQRGAKFVVAPANATTWVVAFSRRLIPGALFSTRTAAIRYAFLLAGIGGFDGDTVLVLGDA